ncbi:Hypothetical protein, putative [Bodo saltans]|uniref:Uncharacterized protein n=1 Tax=Bodo saltans TaxID=75058 RepID=A0A0S4INK3_BODSA|nr:Hypothetical protein, putative [Bodo saltans]|eukprot:CUE86110.1 Hypothetical protein, putative [Bodo saltans]
MYFVLNCGGRSVVVMAESSSALHKVCSEHAGRAVVATVGGVIIDEQFFLMQARSSQDFIVIGFSDAPIPKPAPLQPSAETISQNIVRQEEPARAVVFPGPVVSTTVVPPVAPSMSAPMPVAPRVDPNAMIAVVNGGAGVQRLLEIRKAKALEEAAVAAQKLSADRIASEKRAADRITDSVSINEGSYRIAVPSVAAQTPAAPSPTRAPPPPITNTIERHYETRLPPPALSQSTSTAIPPVKQTQRELLTMDDFARFTTFVDLRLEVLSRISNLGITFGSSSYLHFIRSDTKEMIVTARDFDMLRSTALRQRGSAEWNPNETIAVWRIDGKALESNEPPPSETPFSRFEAPTQPVHSPQVVAEVSRGGARSRNQIKLCVHGVGVVGYIPFDRHFPPSFWLLLQHVAHLTGIPPHMIEIDVICDHIKEVLVVQSDFDVRAVAHMMQASEPTLFAVDLRL